MNKNELTFIRFWVEGQGQALEWKTREGRTYQICGIKGAAGLFERHFHADSHPTRRNAGVTEILGALQKVEGQLELYRLEKGSGTFFNTPADVLKAAKEWCGAKA